MTPASASGYRGPAKSAIAPPCEKPPSTTRPAGTPRPASRAISSSIHPAARRMPRSSWSRAPNPATSYQARMIRPWLMVTGMRGALGKT